MSRPTYLNTTNPNALFEGISSVNLIVVGKDAEEAIQMIPQDYWEMSNKPGYLGISQSAFGKDGIDSSNYRTQLYIGGHTGPQRDFISAQSALTPYFDSVRHILYNTHLNIIFSYLGEAFPSGITPSVARASAKEGAVTIAILPLPHKDEGKIHSQQSKMALGDTRKDVDAVCLLPLEVLYDHFSDSVNFSDLGAAVSRMTTRIIRGIVDLATNPGFRSPGSEEILSFFRGAGDILLGYAELDHSPESSLTGISNALRNPLDTVRQFEGSEKVLISVCQGNPSLDVDSFLKIGKYSRDLLGNDTDITIGNFKPNIPNEKPWIAIYAKDFLERRKDRFDFPISELPPEKAPPRLPAYYIHHHGRNR